jgi:hypothetical protein
MAEIQSFRDLNAYKRREKLRERFLKSRKRFREKSVILCLIKSDVLHAL